MQGAGDQVAGDVADGRVHPGNHDAKEEALLGFAKLLTETPSACDEEAIAGLRSVGWCDAEIAEAVYVVAMFAFFNRVADAFGLVDPGYGTRGPS